MSVSRQKIKRLEEQLREVDPDYLVIPILASPEEAEAIRQEAKRLGKRTLGSPIEIIRECRC